MFTTRTYKTLAAAILSLSIIGGTAPQAAAQSNEDLLRLLGIGAAAVVVGKVIKDRRDDRKAEARAAQQAAQAQQYDYILVDDHLDRHDRQRLGRHKHGKAWNRNQGGNRYSRDFRRANRQCLRQRWTDDGWVRFWNERCLEKAWRKARKDDRYNRGWREDARRECLRKRWTENGWRTYHSKSCLRAKGLRVRHDD